MSPRPKQDRLYLPSVPSPLNPTTCPDCSRTKKDHPRPRPAAKQSPSLSYAQHILRAKAAEAWRSEALRRAYRDLDLHDQQDISDNPLGRAALDMRRDGGACPTAADAKLQQSLGLEKGISPRAAVVVEEKPSFGLLQPFTVDLAHVTAAAAAADYRPRAADGDEEGLRYRGVAKKVLLVVGLLCLSYCLLPGMRYRAAFREGVLAPATS
ncbi:hypothetical protein NKR19_g3680 [Coniochaeta hoffmannii]|uniref:Uncharacterized protein n=1 Tax=Coniochaeta hoffmannii TaxID=91930 RepID=A0AA38W169_9PEZI|nr:hypothetical protein NKR19_g3680 [Coniochaeta hoffmannii]